MCEVYIQKGDVFGVNVESCTQYCTAYGLQCVEMHEDYDDCTKISKYESCDETGGDTSDHICVCGRLNCLVFLLSSF